MSDVLTLYAAQVNCSEIITDDSSNFFRIWAYCIINGCAIAVIIHVACKAFKFDSSEHELNGAYRQESGGGRISLFSRVSRFSDASTVHTVASQRSAFSQGSHRSRFTKILTGMTNTISRRSSRTSKASALSAQSPGYGTARSSVAQSSRGSKCTMNGLHSPSLTPSKSPHFQDCEPIELNGHTIGARDSRYWEEDPYACVEDVDFEGIERFHASANRLPRKRFAFGGVFLSFEAPSQPVCDTAVTWAAGALDPDAGLPKKSSVNFQEDYNHSTASPSKIRAVTLDVTPDKSEISMVTEVLPDREQLLVYYFEAVIEEELYSTAAVEYMQWNIETSKFSVEYYIEFLQVKLCMHYGTPNDQSSVCQVVESTRAAIARQTRRSRVATGSWQSIRSRRSRRKHDVDDPTPNLEAAAKHLRDTSITDVDGKWLSVWSTSSEQLGEIYGPGIELYFRLLRGLSICFAYMAACHLPLAVFSWHGNFLPDTGSRITRSTVGNIGTLLFEAPEGFFTR